MLLLIDNYDSFTYNLVHFLGELGARSLVKRNDRISVDEALALAPEAIVISPGPCDPDRAGICLELIRRAGNIPILGVCLGHQSIGQAFGGRVIRGPVPMHGKLSQVRHGGQGIFAGLPSPFRVTRYHSLVVARDDLPACLQVTAETDDGLIMGFAHADLPIYGVQFHPESIATEFGHKLLGNFLAAARAARQAA
jgi:anthranilate synthase component II